MAIVPIQKIFAYNTGSLISGTTQVGDIAVSEANVEYSDNFGGLQWWGGPDETNGYVIAHTDPSGTHNGGAGGSAFLGFWRSSGLTDSAFLILCNSIPPRIGDTPFTNTSDASSWLTANGYWTSFTSITPTPTATQGAVTPTPTPSVTPTMYYYSVSGYSCGVSCSLVGSYTVMSPTPLTIGYFYNNPENRGYTFEILSLIPQVGGAYDLTGEPGFAVCTDACNQPSPSPTPTVTNTQTPTVTTTPTPSVTNTQTPSVTPTLTPTPSTSPIPVTGYGYNLVVLPYNQPTSGNTIFPTFATPSLNSGTTNPNTFDVNGIYWNIIDNSSVDRTSYYSGMTGVSVTAYFTQNSNTVIYSGSPTAFIFDIAAGGGFNYNPNIRPSQLVLTQSATTNFVTGQTVYISYVVN
jgi:hypothetical protein